MSKKPAASKQPVIVDERKAALHKVNREIAELDAAIKLLDADHKDAADKLEDDRWRSVGKAMRAAIDRRTKLHEERADRMAGIWVEPEQGRPAAPAAARAHRPWEIDEDALKAGEASYPEIMRSADKEAFTKGYQQTMSYWVAKIQQDFRDQGFHADQKIEMDFAVMLMGAERASFVWVSHRCAALEKRVAELVERVHTVEASGIKAGGVWQRALPYARGTVVSHSGSAWVALTKADEGVAPGDDHNVWQLLVKKGSDGRDRT